ncbi:hypothetical protein RvY_01083 [Ramazzottius varieornatus]|uniref:Uncharacterized protein n=1 Tax=Ramazzottius varieornatus TaxID=947166 RepID=A0A1D1UF25_RAMVA|nr:hypothetical protein RvY_01083 [Ramazzottius varieornatus]
MAIFIGLLALCTAGIPHMVSAIPGPIDLAQDAKDATTYPLIQGYFRVEARILSLENPRGTTRNMVPCDIARPGACDTQVFAVIDWKTPNYDFGKDSVPYTNYEKIFDGSGTSSVNINKTITKDVCNDSTRKLNLRVRAVDRDFVGENTIDHWSGFIYTTNRPADSQAQAMWSPVQTTSGHNGSHKIRWQYRWYFIPREQCQASSGSSGIISRFVPFVG